MHRFVVICRGCRSRAGCPWFRFSRRWDVLRCVIVGINIESLAQRALWPGKLCFLEWFCRPPLERAQVWQRMGGRVLPGDGRPKRFHVNRECLPAAQCRFWGAGRIVTRRSSARAVHEGVGGRAVVGGTSFFLAGTCLGHFGLCVPYQEVSQNRRRRLLVPRARSVFAG